MRADPFAYCRRQGIRVARRSIASPFLTGHFAGEVFVILSTRQSRTAQRRALVTALLAHPTLDLVNGGHV